MSLLQSHFRRSPSCHNWSQPVTDRHNQVEAVTYRNFTLMANTLLYLSEGVWVEGFCAQTWLDVMSVCTKLELRQRGAGRDTTLVMSPCAVNEKIFNSKWYLRDRFISGFHTLMTTSFLIVPTFTNPKIDPSSTSGKSGPVCHPFYLLSREFCEISLDIITDHALSRPRSSADAMALLQHGPSAQNQS